MRVCFAACLAHPPRQHVCGGTKVAKGAGNEPVVHPTARQRLHTTITPHSQSTHPNSIRVQTARFTSGASHRTRWMDGLQGWSSQIRGLAKNGSNALSSIVLYFRWSGRQQSSIPGQRTSVGSRPKILYDSVHNRQRANVPVFAGPRMHIHAESTSMQYCSLLCSYRQSPLRSSRTTSKYPGTSGSKCPARTK